MTSKQRDTRRGPAYPFWVRLKERLAELGMTQVELLSQTGLGPMTVDRLRTSPARAEGPRRTAVLAIADVLGIPKDEALVLAGLAPAKESVDTRAAITSDPALKPHQRDALLSVLDIIEASNRQEAGGNSADRVDRGA